MPLLTLKEQINTQFAASSLSVSSAWPLLLMAHSCFFFTAELNDSAAMSPADRMQALNLKMISLGKLYAGTPRYFPLGIILFSVNTVSLRSTFLKSTLVNYNCLIISLGALFVWVRRHTFGFCSLWILLPIIWTIIRSDEEKPFYSSNVSFKICLQSLRPPFYFFISDFLVKFLEQEVCKLNWDVGFVTFTMQEIGVQLPRLLEVYDQLFKARVWGTRSDRNGVRVCIKVSWNDLMKTGHSSFIFRF